MLQKLVRKAREGVYSVQRAQVRPTRRGSGKTRAPRFVAGKRPKIVKKKLAADMALAVDAGKKLKLR
jgi:hypothetical protein